MYNLILVEAGIRESTTMRRMNAITGDYLRPLYLSEEQTFASQSLEIIKLLKRDKPDKIIFDKTYTEGVHLYNMFIYLSTEDEHIEIDSFGLITYKGD